MKIRKLLNYQYFFLFILLHGSLLSQEIILDFSWSSPNILEQTDDKTTRVFNLENGYLDADKNYLPKRKFKFPLKGKPNNYSLKLYNFESLAISENEKQINIIKEDISEEVLFYSNVVCENQKYFLVIEIDGLLFREGNLHKLIKAKFYLSIENGESNKVEKSSKRTSSVQKMSTGNWWKFAITSTGVHLLTFQDLKSQNILSSSVPSDQIKIYGNQGDMLPFLINDVRHGSLEEMAIEIIDGGDGNFDLGDSILFYGEKGSNDRFSASKLDYQVLPNYYSDSNFVFLTFNSESPKRISTVDHSSWTSVADVVIGDFIWHHEKDSINFINSGRNWVGESIVSTNPLRFKIPTKHVKSENIQLITSNCARSLVMDNNDISYIVNSDTLGIYSYPNVSSIYYNDYVKFGTNSFSFTSASDTLDVGFYYHKAYSDNLAFLDYFTLIYKKELVHEPKTQIFIQNKEANINPEIYKYKVKSVLGSTIIWDISNFNSVNRIAAVKSNDTLNFKANTAISQKFIAFDNLSLLNPSLIGKIENQNLNYTDIPEYLIITHPLFLTQAKELANFHEQEDGLKAKVVNVEHIYNQHSSGRKEAGAIRDYIRELYQHPSGTDTLKYVLLFGDGSYDPKFRITNNKNFIPTYQSDNSIKLTASYASDDFYAVLDSSEGDFTNNDQLDIAVGRIPVNTVDQANAVIQKIKQYYNNYESKQPNGDEFTSFGSWRNKILFVADDGDNNTHIEQAEKLSALVDTSIQNLNIKKIYVDAYVKQVNPSGNTAPDAKKEISKSIEEGFLMINYTGHGGEYGWSSERILDVNDIYKLSNKSKLPLVMTATCEFSRYDDPNRESAGELLFLEPEAGAIALFTTTRLVFSIPNFTLNRSLYEILTELQFTEDLRIGDIFKKTKLKNNAGTNDRNFTLLGDPALRITIPKEKIVVDSITSLAFQKLDTIKGLTRAIIYGHVENHNAELLTDFTGTLEMKIFDKMVAQKTLDNEKKGTPMDFNTQTSLLFRGNYKINAGKFEGEFIIPKNILLNYGACKISLYATANQLDAAGNSKKYILGDLDTSAQNDSQGPSIEVYLQDSTFTFGSSVEAQPYFLAKLTDSSGINLVPDNIGKNLVLTLNQSPETEYILNNYYQTNSNSYKKGEVQYRLSDFKSGAHTLEFVASDNYNNTSKAYTEFIIEENPELALQHILNYPNPFTTNTGFYFEHNQYSGTLGIHIQILSITGKLIKTITQQLDASSQRIGPIEWDGLDDYGDKIGRGVYIYKIKVETEAGDQVEQIEKLVILR